MREQEVRELYEAYLQVHQPQEEVEQLDELAPATPRNRQRAVNRRQRQFDRTPMSNSTGGSGEERAALSRLTRAERLSAAASERRKVDENYDAFDVILEHLVAEGYADTNESALVIMANMSEEWRQSIVEGEENKEDSQKPFTGEGPKKPKGWKPSGPKLKTGQRPGYAR
jgi:hypothetical protein